MRKTLFTGITVLTPDESILSDDGAFIGRDRDTIDRFLEIGAKTHRHNGLAGLVNPEPPLADVEAIPSGGTIAGDTTFTLGYTLLDQEGGETMLSPTTTITTPPPLEQPLAAPIAEVDYDDGGVLLTDTYYYTLTFVDSEGGETPMGAWVSVEREPGFPNARILLTGLSSGVVAASAVGWRLFRAVGGGTFDYLASGGSASDGYADEGLVGVNCDIHPPPDEVNTTNQINQLRVELPSAIGGASAFNLYGTNTGQFLGDVLIDGYPASSAGQTVYITTYSPDPGAPPDRNHSIGGASKIDPDTDMLDWHWKRPVVNIAALPSGTKGDVRLVYGASALYYLPANGDGSEDWDLLAAGGGSAQVGDWVEIVPFEDAAPDVAFLGNGWGASASHQGPEYRVEGDILRMRGMIAKASGAVGETVVALPSALQPPHKVTHAGVLASYLDVIPGASARLMQSQTHADLNELQYAIDQTVPGGGGVLGGGAYMLFAGDDFIDRGIWAVVGESFSQSVVAILDSLPDDLQGLAYDAERDRFYFASFTNGIYYIVGDGGEAQVPQLLDTTGATVDQPSDVSIDVAGERLFWNNQGDGSISYCDLDGGNGGDLDTTGASVVLPMWIAIDNDAGRVYWLDDDAGDYTIQYADLDGGGGGELDTSGATDLSTATDLAIDTATGRIFFSYDGSNGIEYADLAPGGNTGVVDDTGATAFESLCALAVAGDRLYWLNRATGGGVISSTDLATLSDAEDYFVPDIPAGDLLSFGFVFLA